MKRIIILMIAIAAVQVAADASFGPVPQHTGTTKEITNAYLKLKNALVKDNSSEAAEMGKAVETALKSFDNTHLNIEQKKLFDDVKSDALENAEHIGESSGNIVHQREHFELLSKDIYDLVKKVGSGQLLYWVLCPTYNSGKGAYWISEVKEIQNPYLGKSMPTCGTIKEEIKP
ncbi:MAG: DUF3347 domain-containing protein [Bacteroidota bacterium]|nr:DUF3347 domain-containing protein [Bacteroidota bacterium]